MLVLDNISRQAFGYQMVEPSNTQLGTGLMNPLEEVGVFAVASHIIRIDPQLSVDLISILDAYLTEEMGTDKPFLVKDGVKILL